ncbi:MAG: hypothetical protein QOC92_4472 [Acidimicrobiaceae bacterium]
MSQAAPLGSHAAPSAQAPPFSCPCSDPGEGVAYLRPVGEVDYPTALDLREALTEALAGAQLVVLDLAQIVFIDSSGVHAIVGAAADARRLGHQLVLLGGPDRVREAFALTDSWTAVDTFDPYQGSQLWRRHAGSH